MKEKSQKELTEEFLKLGIRDATKYIKENDFWFQIKNLEENDTYEYDPIELGSITFQLDGGKERTFGIDWEDYTPEDLIIFNLLIWCVTEKINKEGIQKGIFGFKEKDIEEIDSKKKAEIKISRIIEEIKDQYISIGYKYYYDNSILSRKVYHPEKMVKIIIGYNYAGFHEKILQSEFFETETKKDSAKIVDKIGLLIETGIVEYLSNEFDLTITENKLSKLIGIIMDEDYKTISRHLRAWYSDSSTNTNYPLKPANIERIINHLSTLQIETLSRKIRDRL